ncbi:lupus la protein-related [Holotrichia oblita]|uniref:Lupus la protein-related n=1 Tax=Holotrichia oblita TaxID=644536 RepID=A0ACB9TRQ0_HOLOL|nr:lupus la protein-related [Holotrichia oblita]
MYVHNTFLTNSIRSCFMQEERRRTGRYVAGGTAILLSLLGLYQAFIVGTPEYAALFVPAVIMFVYVLCILHASKHQQKLAKALEQEALKEIVVASDSKPDLFEPPKIKMKNLKRSFSIA